MQPGKKKTHTSGYIRRPFYFCSECIYYACFVLSKTNGGGNTFILETCVCSGWSRSRDLHPSSCHATLNVALKWAARSFSADIKTLWNERWSEVKWLTPTPKINSYDQSREDVLEKEALYYISVVLWAKHDRKVDYKHYMPSIIWESKVRIAF